MMKISDGLEYLYIKIFHCFKILSYSHSDDISYILHRILSSINRLASNLNISQSNSTSDSNTTISRPTFSIFINEPPPSEDGVLGDQTISAIFGSNVSEINNLNNGMFSSAPDQANSSASVFLSADFFQNLQETTILNDTNVRPRLVTVVYLLNSPLFPSMANLTLGSGNQSNSSRLMRGSVVFSLSRAENQGAPPTNLTTPVCFFFQTSEVSS